MKKAKYQQYLIVLFGCILVPYPFSFSYQQNMVAILIIAAQVRHLLEGRRLLERGVYFYGDTQSCGAYWGPGAYQRKYGNKMFEYFYVDISTNNNSSCYVYQKYLSKYGIITLSTRNQKQTFADVLQNSYLKQVIQNFTIFIGKHLRWSLFQINSQASKGQLY